MKRFTLIAAAMIIIITAVPVSAGELSLGAESAVLMTEDGDVIFEHNADERLPMASTTKIMTALVAIENCPLDRVVTVDEKAVGVEGSSVYLEKGEKLAMGELLYALMLQSANDAAAAIAIEVGGSVEKFADLMNKKAAELELSNTHFTNPHGLDDEEHFTTARELAKITTEALKNETFREIVSTYKTTIHGKEYDRVLVNHNRLLREYDGAIGVKTGYTRRCGRCLVSAAEREGLRIIAVTLSDPNDWRDHKKLLDYGFSRYETLTLTGDNGIIVEIPQTGSGNEFLRTVTDKNVKVTLPRYDSTITVTAQIPRFLFSPVKKGDNVGKLIFRRDGKIIKELALYACG